jgi:hypothetical protein
MVAVPERLVTVSVTKTVEVELTPVEIAQVFAAMSHDEQAAFFVEFARLANTWTSFGRLMQLHAIGRRLIEDGAVLAIESLDEILEAARDPR